MFGNANDQKFFTLLKAAAGNIRESAQMFTQMIEHLSSGQEYAARLKDLEHNGDRYTQQLGALLNATFVTPLEREDIWALAQELDDMVDGIEAVASRIALYNLTESDEHIRAFTQILEQQTTEIAAAVDLLSDKNLLPIREKNSRIKMLEKGGDEALRKGLTALFAHPTDPIYVIKMKEIYEYLESTTDRAEDVADTLESVIMKNA